MHRQYLESGKQETEGLIRGDCAEVAATRDCVAEDSSTPKRRNPACTESKIPTHQRVRMEAWRNRKSSPKQRLQILDSSPR